MSVSGQDTSDRQAALGGSKNRVHARQGAPGSPQLTAGSHRGATGLAGVLAPSPPRRSAAA
jgi:hypothetical protein